MALESAKKGAKYSIGFKRSVWNISCDSFIPAFFKSLSEGLSVKEAARMAAATAIAENRIWWVAFGMFNCDIRNPIIYETGGSKMNLKDVSEPSSFVRGFRNAFIDDAGFSKTRNCAGIDCGKAFAETSEMVSDLRAKYDDVRLFVGLEKGEPKALAMCSSFETAQTIFYDLSLKTVIKPCTFEKMVEETL